MHQGEKTYHELAGIWLYISYMSIFFERVHVLGWPLIYSSNEFAADFP